MKIALVSEHASPLATLGGADAGGQNVYVAEIGSALARMGHEVTVFTRRDQRALPECVGTECGMCVVHVSAGPAEPVTKDELLPYMDAFALELRAHWAGSPPDVVHAHFWMSGRATLRAALPLGIPVVQTFHALGLEKRRHQGSADASPASRIGEEIAILRDAERVIATSSNEVFELCRMGADPHKLKIVPCGVNLAHFDACREPFERPRRQTHRIVTLSRLVERKGVADVIAALALLPQTELLIAGGAEAALLERDSEVRRLREVARASGVADRVSFLGRVDRASVPKLLRSADVVVCAPWYEPFGIVPLEAMACGVPVVATAVGGQTDTVVDGITGCHVPPRDPHEIASAVRALLDSPVLRANLGRAARNRVVKRFTWKRVAAETANVYGSVVRYTGRAESHTA